MPHQGAVGGHMYSAGSMGACFSEVANTITSVLTLDVMKLTNKMCISDNQITPNQTKNNTNTKKITKGTKHTKNYENK
jgi:hypothetical protein